MSSNKSKMLAGELYNANDPALLTERRKAAATCQAFNEARADAFDERRLLLQSLFGRSSNFEVTAPFHCDYGYNIELGENVNFNFNCVVLDVCLVRIGSNALFGPGVHIYTATHPMLAIERRSGLELGKPVTIEDNVWVGGGAIICPGVTIGHGSAIGAGSVVTKHVPAGVFAAGNPRRVIRTLQAKRRQKRA